MFRSTSQDYTFNYRAASISHLRYFRHMIPKDIPWTDQLLADFAAVYGPNAISILDKQKMMPENITESCVLHPVEVVAEEESMPVVEVVAEEESMPVPEPIQSYVPIAGEEMIQTPFGAFPKPKVNAPDRKIGDLTVREFVALMQSLGR